MNASTPIEKAAAAARHLADALAELADERGGAGARDAAYDSQHLPPRTSRRRFAELCRSGQVPGAYRDGRDWVCPNEAWHSSRARAPRAKPVVGSTGSLAQRADDLLRRRGLKILPMDPRARDDDST